MFPFTLAYDVFKFVLDEIHIYDFVSFPFLLIVIYDMLNFLLFNAELASFLISVLRHIDTCCCFVFLSFSLYFGLYIQRVLLDEIFLYDFDFVIAISFLLHIDTL